jgi:diguanylate cyclase (GGDEF)-like protein
MAKKLGDLSQECKEMEEKANTDPLTHLYNRRYFDLQFPLQMRMAARHKITTSIFLIDIDYFKLFNDTYGHIRGDKCLQKISQTILNCFNRSSDICARFGGEEFVIFALGMSTIQSTEKAKKLLDNIFQLAIPHAKSNLNYVTASIGISNSITTPNIDTISLLNSADEALYKAKSKGRNTIICA